MLHTGAQWTEDEASLSSNSRAHAVEGLSSILEALGFSSSTTKQNTRALSNTTVLVPWLIKELSLDFFPILLTHEVSLPSQSTLDSRHKILWLMCENVKSNVNILKTKVFWETVKGKQQVIKLRWPAHSGILVSLWLRTLGVLVLTRLSQHPYACRGQCKNSLLWYSSCKIKQYLHNKNG